MSTTGSIGTIGLDNGLSDYYVNMWVRFERDLHADAAGRFSGATLTSVMGVEVKTASGKTTWMDDVALSNARTVETNVLGPGSVGPGRRVVWDPCRGPLGRAANPSAEALG